MHGLLRKHGVLNRNNSIGMAGFRFEDLEIWKESIAVSVLLFDIAESVAEKHKYRFAEQLNGAALSISNNIAEGSGSYSNKDFANFLAIARKSVYECVNILYVFEKRGLIDSNELEKLKNRLVELSRQIHYLRKKILL